MSLHPILAEKLSEAVLPAPPLSMTLRDARLPAVSGKVHAVIGMRRAGKTTFLRQLLAEYRAELPTEQAIYLSFDDDRLGELPLEQLGFLLEEYYRRYPGLRGTKQVHWFLDEIQLVSGWERFARRVLDTEKISLVVSGSSAKMLSREVHSSLRGRGMETIIRPFGFREFLRHRREEPAKPPERWTAPDRSHMEHQFREFLIQGGFPEIQNLPTNLRIDLLQGYVDTVLFRDVVERHAISQVAALRWIVRHALRNPAGRVSIYRLYQDLRSQGHAIGKDAVHAMVGHLIDAFLISAVSIATESERQRNSNPRKIYPSDPGLISAFAASGRANAGHALETVVFHELDRAMQKSPMSNVVAIWKSISSPVFPMAPRNSSKSVPTSPIPPPTRGNSAPSKPPPTFTPKPPAAFLCLTATQWTEQSPRLNSRSNLPATGSFAAEGFCCLFDKVLPHQFARQRARSHKVGMASAHHGPHLNSE